MQQVAQRGAAEQRAGQRQGEAFEDSASASSRTLSIETSVMLAWRMRVPFNNNLY